MSQKVRNVQSEMAKPVCKSCGSSNMSFDAIVVWDTKTNSFVCTGADILPYDDSDSHCRDCGAENTDTWFKIEE